MTQANYFLSLLAQLEAVEASDFITPEEVSVLAADVLRDLRPSQLSRNYEATRAVVVKKLESLIIPESPLSRTEPKNETTVSRVPGPSTSETTATEAAEPKEPEVRKASGSTNVETDVLVSARPAVRSKGKRKVTRK